MAFTRRRRRRGSKYMAKQAICTKFIGPTNTKPARIVATAGGGRTITVSFNSGLGTFESHEAAAYALADKLGWNGTLRGGGVKNGYCFVFTK